jgi:hypothetical protein
MKYVKNVRHHLSQPLFGCVVHLLSERLKVTSTDIIPLKDYGMDGDEEEEGDHVDQDDDQRNGVAHLPHGAHTLYPQNTEGYSRRAGGH